MSKLKIAGPALLYVGFLLPSFAQDTTASMFAKQVEQDIAALSSQPSVDAWQKLHPDEELELANYDPAKDSERLDLRLDYDSWCAASISRSPSTFGRSAVFFLPSVKIDAVPPLPRKASVRDGCRMQAFQYNASLAIPADDLIREFSSVWGLPNRSRGTSGSQFGDPEILYGGYAAIWDHDGVSIHLSFQFASGQSATHDVPESMVLSVKRDAVPPAPCSECTSSLMYPLYGEGLTAFVQEAAQIAAQDPALTRQIVEWSRQKDNPKWSVDATLARNNLRRWLEVAKQRPPHQRAAALLLADLYVQNTGSGDAAIHFVLYRSPGVLYKGLGAEYGRDEDYLNNFRRQAEKMDDGGEVSEMANLLTVSEECPGFDKRPWPDVAIEDVEGFLARFPSDQWTPYVDFALARAHSAKLLWSYPGGSTDDYSTEGSPLSPAGKERERATAIEYFKAFLDAKPGGPEGAFAWREAWRLLAGLPPSRISWGCTGE